MMRLTEKPTTTENRAAFARQVYKDPVMACDNRPESELLHTL